MKLFIDIPKELEQRFQTDGLEQFVVDIPEEFERRFQADKLEQLVNSLYKLLGVEPQESEDKDGDTMMLPDTVEEFIVGSRERVVIDACRAAVDKYGADNQVKKAIEELAELQVELCHYLCGRGRLDHISEEMADVEIMLAQLKLIFQNEIFVEEWEEIKAMRLMEKINADNKDCNTNVEKHAQICSELNALYERKNHDYGDSF